MRNPIAHRAVLVSLTQRMWKGTATDREVAAQAELSAGAEQGTMTVIKELTPKYLMLQIKGVARLGRTEHYRMTVPGLITGQHLLPTAMFETYMLAQGAIKDQFFEAVEDFIKLYPDIRHKAASRFGTAYRDKDFPSVHGIRSYFDYSYHPSPVPDVSDWRLDGVDSKHVDELRKEVEDSVANMYREATKTVFERAREMLESLISQAKNYSLDAPGAMLRDATIEHVRELSSLVCSMNVTGDPVLEDVGQRMLKEFADLSGKELRSSADSRKATMQAGPEDTRPHGRREAGSLSNSPVWLPWPDR